MNDILTNFRPITLDEMNGIRLMNRTDTKFVTDINTLYQLLEMARNDYRIQDVCGQRNIPYFTVYFDTHNYDMFNAHQDGKCNRQKVRIRSYVNSHLNFLEVKTKDNHGRTRKKRIPLDGFDPLHPDYGITFTACDTCEYEFLSKILRYQPETLIETIQNNFNRITLVNNAKTERLTIDTSLAFDNLITHDTYKMDNAVVIELKRDGLQHSPVLHMLNELRIKPQGFSKYAIGTAITNSHLKQNRFKMRIHKIEKTINKHK